MHRAPQLRPICWLLASCTPLLLPATAGAHFVLQSPPAATEQNELGDPQKAAPCGDNGSAIATGVVTTYAAGSILTVTINETITHPGHYRVALATDDVSQLPEDPEVTARPDMPGMPGTPCWTAEIQDPPVFPVLADGIFEHTASFSEPQSIEIQLPEGVTCTRCTLQVIQFMSEHALNVPGGCYYHHCAEIAIEPGPSGGSTSMGDDSGGGSEGGPFTGGPAAEGGPTDPGEGGRSTGDPEIAGTDSTTTDGSDGGGSTGEAADAESGCACSTDDRPGRAIGWLLGAVVLGGLGRRRRSH